MDVVGQDLAGEVQPAELFDDGKGQRQGGGGLEGGVAQQGGQAQTCAGFEGGLEEDIAEGQEEGVAEDARVAWGQGVAAAVLDGDGEAGKEDVEEQEEERREHEEEKAEGEGADDLDFKRPVGEDKGGPGHVEEKDVEGGRVRGRGGGEEDREDGEGEQYVHHLCGCARLRERRVWRATSASQQKKQRTAMRAMHALASSVGLAWASAWKL